MDMYETYYTLYTGMYYMYETYYTLYTGMYYIFFETAILYDKKPIQQMIHRPCYYVVL
jgi:hypothetical protein